LIYQYDVFSTREAANARVAELHKISGYEDAFVVDNDETAVNGEVCWQEPSHWSVDKNNKTVSFNQAQFDKDKTDENMLALRAERNERLEATDIIVLPDRWNAMNDDTKTAWTNYRQALRDLPANTADPTDITWPTKPS